MSKKQSKKTKPAKKSSSTKSKSAKSAPKKAKKVAKPAKVKKKSAVKPAPKKKAKPVKKAVSKPAKKATVAKKGKSKPSKIKTAKKVVKATKPKKKEIKKVVKKAIKKVVAPKKAAKKIKQAAVKKAVKPAKPLKAVKVKTEKSKPVKEEKLKKESKPLLPKKDTAPVKPRGKSGRKPKNKGGDDDEPEIIADEFIEEIIKSTKVERSPKQPKIIKTFINPSATLQVAEPEGKQKSQLPKKEPKGKFELEYVVRTSAPLLYEFISTPSGLSEWFADDVNIKDGVFTFFWDGSEQKAKLLAFKEEKFIRFQWVDKPIGTYVEFRIDKDDLTGDVSLIIIDFAEEGPDTDSSKKLWDSQVNKLLHVLGSF